jgi:hypothetical protein
VPGYDVERIRAIMRVILDMPPATPHDTEEDYRRRTTVLCETVEAKVPGSTEDDICLAFDWLFSVRDKLTGRLN